MTDVACLRYVGLGREGDIQRAQVRTTPNASAQHSLIVSRVGPHDSFSSGMWTCALTVDHRQSNASASQSQNQAIPPAGLQTDAAYPPSNSPSPPTSPVQRQNQGALPPAQPRGAEASTADVAAQSTNSHAPDGDAPMTNVQAVQPAQAHSDTSAGGSISTEHSVPRLGREE